MTTASRLCRISWQIVVSTLSSSPGFSPNASSSREAHVIHLSSVTRATAVNPIPVVRLTTSRMVETAAIPLTLAMSRSKSIATPRRNFAGRPSPPRKRVLAMVRSTASQVLPRQCYSKLRFGKGYLFPMERFSTARLTAERVREDHLADLVALHLHAEVSRYLGGVRPAERTKRYPGIRNEHPAQRTR